MEVMHRINPVYNNNTAVVVYEYEVTDTSSSSGEEKLLNTGVEAYSHAYNEKR